MGDKSDALVFTVVTMAREVRVKADRFLLRDDAVDLYVGRKRVGHFKAGYWSRIFVEAARETP